MGSLGALKLSLVVASLALSLAEVARARRSEGVSLLGALGLYLQMSVVSVLVANALRSAWRSTIGAIAAAFLAGVAPAMLTLWLLERVELRTAAGGGRLVLHGLALAALLAIPIGSALRRLAEPDDRAQLRRS
ncbi:MAG TPA: hypothetical protein VJ596_12570 [Gemmatimonadaceae bacterium]|nr:hypothetical protein [Gemmatimonadaceae bacterium]